MPRPIINARDRLVPPGPLQRAGTATGAGVRMLTTPRSARYREAIGRLDASASLGVLELAEIADALAREFAERWATVPLGFVAHCHLGPPYEAHTLTIDGQIIEHYERGRALPGRLEAARSLARTDHHLVIEVYPDRLVCVRADGSVVTMED